MGDITTGQLSTFYPQQGDDLRALLARFTRSRLPSASVQTLASAARTVTTYGSIIELNGQDIAFFLNCTAAGATGISLVLRGMDPSGADIDRLHSSVSITGTGTIAAIFRRSQFLVVNSASSRATGVCPLPSRVRISVDHAGVDSYTYSVNYQLMGLP